MSDSEEVFEVLSPVDGIMMPLELVPDPVFARGMLGKGCAISPTNGEVRSPISGKVAVAFPTGHAIGVVGRDQAEVLVHIGLDTVELNGSAFRARLAVGEDVSAGDLVIEADLAQIEEAGFSTVIPVVVTNTDEFDFDMARPMGAIRAGEPMFTLRRRTPVDASLARQAAS
ncbi:PTS sugar transporter subunit IIA [Frondihabitans cladoniiphilus]|uniref:PTS EIIA type-1 domain-containing protein n=1 Tax=Frondihabitans cladoniiphilus TaxID=715785 RepID=A0ABP8VIT7_9MICO